MTSTLPSGPVCPGQRIAADISPSWLIFPERNRENADDR
jgi:hypothetical protein